MTARDAAAVGVVLALLTGPLWRAGRWEGADEIATARSSQRASLVLPLPLALSAEVESGLFAAQAALGAGIIGYLIGVRRARGVGRDGRQR